MNVLCMWCDKSPLKIKKKLKVFLINLTCQDDGFYKMYCCGKKSVCFS